MSLLFHLQFPLVLPKCLNGILKLLVVLQNLADIVHVGLLDCCNTIKIRLFLHSIPNDLNLFALQQEPSSVKLR